MAQSSYKHAGRYIGAVGRRGVACVGTKMAASDMRPDNVPGEMRVTLAMVCNEKAVMQDRAEGC